MIVSDFAQSILSKLSNIISTQSNHTTKLDNININIENSNQEIINKIINIEENVGSVPIGESTKLTIASADKALHLTGLTGSNYLSVDKWGVWLSENVDIYNYSGYGTNIFLRKYDFDLNLIGRVQLGNSTAPYVSRIIGGLEEYNRYIIYFTNTQTTWPTWYLYCLDKETLNTTLIWTYTGNSTGFSYPYYNCGTITFSDGSMYYLSSSPSLSNGVLTVSLNQWVKGTSTATPLTASTILSTVESIGNERYYNSNRIDYDGQYWFFSPRAKINMNTKTLSVDNNFLNASSSLWACNNGHITLFNSFFETKPQLSTEYTKAEANLSENNIYGIYNFENSIVGRNCDYNGVGILDKYDYDLNLKKSVKILNFPKSNILYQSQGTAQYRIQFFNEKYIYLIISNNIFRVPW